MPVYFIYRNFAMGPTGKYLKHFEDDTVLDWFRRHWTHLAVDDMEIADARLTEVLGCDGWFMSNPFVVAAEERMQPPQDYEQLLGLLRRRSGDDVQSDSPHLLQVLTEEDGEGGAIFFIDGHFLERHRGLASYLLRQDWRLPSGHGDGPYTPAHHCQLLDPSGDSAGVTYFILLTEESKYPLDDLTGGYRLEGVRVQDLAQYFCRTSPESDGWPHQLRFLPSLLLGSG